MTVTDDTQAAAAPAVESPTEQAPLLIRALRGEALERTPVWFMRQAGRSLPEYHETRGNRSLLDVVKSPADAAEITLQPVRRHKVDAAILYSDIVVPVAAAGLPIAIKPGVGPVLDEPIRSRADLDRIGPFDPNAHVPYVQETVRIMRRELDPSVALIGFAGAPFTMASYLVEGGPSKQQARTKAMMAAEPELFRDLAERLADIAIASLRAQIDAGAQAVQLFDSWIGSLSVAQYERHIAPVVTRIMSELADTGVPRIVFGIGTGHLLEQLAATGADCVGVDWRTTLSDARARLGNSVAIQGNLDPTYLLAQWPVVEREVRAVVADAPKRGYVFNLGHGVLPDTPADIPTRVASLVRELTQAEDSSA
jgi:uroporphyrinogen decarboxylase